MNIELAEVIPVGEHLLVEIEKHGWTQAEFAEILGRPAQVVSEIIAGKKEITRDSAAQIAAAVGPSPEYWLILQDQYHLWKHAQDENTRRQLDDVRLRAKLSQRAPIAVLRKRGLITATTLRGQADQLCELLRIDDLDDEPKFAMVARRSNVEEPATPTQSTWLACVRQQAARQPVPPYSPERLRALAARLSSDTCNPSAFIEFPDRFAEAGVRLVYIEAFPSSKIDGASFDMDGTPVIGLSGRGHRLDKVLFTLLHEVAHIELGHITSTAILDLDNPHGQKQEDDANELAGKWAIPAPLPAIPERIGQSWLNEAAESMGVHPIVIVGRLQNDQVLNWRSALAKDAPTVTKYLQRW